jgi:chromosome segregation ATPase
MHEQEKDRARQLKKQIDELENEKTVNQNARATSNSDAEAQEKAVVAEVRSQLEAVEKELENEKSEKVTLAINLEEMKRTNEKENAEARKLAEEMDQLIEKIVQSELEVEKARAEIENEKVGKLELKELIRIGLSEHERLIGEFEAMKKRIEGVGEKEAADIDKYKKEIAELNGELTHHKEILQEYDEECEKLKRKSPN